MRGVLQNIPFFWTSLAHWMTCMLYICLLPKRLKYWQTVMVSVPFLAVLLGFMYWTAPKDGAVFNLLMVMFAVLTAVPLGLLCQLDRKQTLYYGTRAFILGGLVSSLPWQLYVYYVQRVPVLGHRLVEAAFMFGFYMLLCGLMALAELPHKKTDAEMDISWLSCLSTLVTGLLIYIISSISFAPIETPFGGSTYAEAFNLRSIVYFAGTALLFAAHVQLSEAHVLVERDALQNMLEMQYRNYQLGRESMDLINRKYHDLKHQIAVLRSGIGNDQKLEFLDKMEREIQVYETQNKTGNQILDTILASESLRCQQEDIRLTCVADGSALRFMEITDISALFGNALDNAIEATRQLSDPEQRLIHLSVSRHKGFLRIQVENRYAGTLRMRNGLPVTTKSNTQYHGYGVKSIFVTAEKYGGSATCQAKDGWFELRILIPLQDAQDT